MRHVAEEAFTFSCRASQLLGIIHRPDDYSRQGVLVVVGGPQYRAGSHRQFTLLARHLAGKGIAAMRFDYRGMGDSEGEERDFEMIADDMEAAISVFMEKAGELDSVILWGLCDAASAILMETPTDPRVSGMVLLNPWVRSESGAAKTYIKHYYLQRLFDRALWTKLAKGKFNFRESLTSLVRLLGQAVFKPPASGGQDRRNTPFQDRMREGLGKFNKPVLLILSGNQDFVADEFRDLTGSSAEWNALLNRETVTRLEFPEANHTFSRKCWRDTVAEKTAEWVSGLTGESGRPDLLAGSGK